MFHAVGDLHDAVHTLHAALPVPGAPAPTGVPVVVAQGEHRPAAAWEPRARCRDEVARS